METLTVYFIIAILILIINVVLTYITFNYYKKAKQENHETLVTAIEFTEKFGEASFAVKDAKEKAVEFYEKCQIKNKRTTNHLVSLFESFLVDLKKEAIKKYKK